MMDKEMLTKRIEILDKIDLLKDKCKCRSFNSNCDNCKELVKYGGKLNKLVSKRKKMNGISDESKPGRKITKYPTALTVAEYEHLRKLKLSDEKIAKVFETTKHFIVRFKKDKNIKTDQYGFAKKVTVEDKQRQNELIIRERNRIKNKARAN